MEIPLYIFLIFYFIGLAIFCMSTFFNLYHIIKFGMFDFTGKLNTAVFICYSIIVLTVTVLLLREIPWFDSITFGQLFDFGNLLNSNDTDF